MGYAVLSTLMLILIENFIKTNYKINIIIGLTLLGIAFLMLDKSEKNIILKKIKIR
jgi:hypothetical protein